MHHSAGVKPRALIYVTRAPAHHPAISVITDPLFYLLAIPAVTLLGLGKGGFAGLGMISTPLLALVVPPLEGAAILLPILIMPGRDLGVDLSPRLERLESEGAAARLRDRHRRGHAVRQVYVSNAAIELTVGGDRARLRALCVARHVAARLSRTRAGEGRGGRIRPWACSGARSRASPRRWSQVGAPPFQIHVLPQRLDKLTLVGTTVIFFAILNWMKIVPYFALGQFSPRNFATSLVLLPLAVAANFLGIWLVRRTPTEAFYRIAYLLMLLISLALLWQGARGFVR